MYTVAVGILQPNPTQQELAPIVDIFETDVVAKIKKDPDCMEKKAKNCEKIKKDPDCMEEKAKNCEKVKKDPNCSKENGKDCEKIKDPDCIEIFAKNCTLINKVIFHKSHIEVSLE